jgi:hypothetical protein
LYQEDKVGNITEVIRMNAGLGGIIPGKNRLKSAKNGMKTGLTRSSFSHRLSHEH